MPVHEAVLAAAQRLCAARPNATFTPDEIVRALPHLNAQTVRTHVTSRCCVNERPHHQSRLGYFRKIRRGVYEILPGYRGRRTGRGRVAPRVRSASRPQHDTIHAIITKDDGTYVVDCHEVAVVTQGRTLDEALANLLDAIALHLQGEDLAAFGLEGLRRIHVSYDLPADVTAA
jgi:predicted RNase H-like HicB family nuclease